MKVFVIYDKDGWEILGVDKIFTTYEEARDYVLTWKITSSANIDVLCQQEIFEISIEA